MQSRIVKQCRVWVPVTRDLVGANSSNGWIEMAMVPQQSDLKALHLSSKPAANAKHIPSLKYLKTTVPKLEAATVMRSWMF